MQSSEGPAVSCSIVVIAEIEGAFLVGVPQTAWHRTAGRRYLPRTALTRTASLGRDRGLRGRWGLEPDVPFLGYGSRSQLSLPLRDGCGALCLPHPGGGGRWRAAFGGGRVFGGPAHSPRGRYAQGAAEYAGLAGWSPRHSGIGDLGPSQAGGPLIAGLDPAAVEAARTASVPEDQLIRMSQLG